jgi:hypothetical protein
VGPHDSRLALVPAHAGRSPSRRRVHRRFVRARTA